MLYLIVHTATIRVYRFNIKCREIIREDVTWIQINWASRCSLHLKQPQQLSRQQMPSPAAEAAVRNRVYSYSNTKTRINKPTPPQLKREAVDG